MPSGPVVRAVLWDADGVVQVTPPGAWDLAVRVVEQFPGALTGTPALDETAIRAAAEGLGLGDRVDELLTVWSTFHVPTPTLEIVAAVRAAGTPCHLATNQDTHRARAMREQPAYRDGFDRLFFSCDLGVAKPDAGFFERVVTALDLAPGAVLFLDDRPENVAAARAVGLRAGTWTQEDGVDRLCEILRAHGVPIDGRVEPVTARRPDGPGGAGSDPCPS